MSLLMQALKKAARNQGLPEEDEGAPAAEPLEHLVALTPDDVLSGRVPPAHGPLAWTLEPLEERSAGLPAGGLSEQVPALEPALPAPHDPTPPQARRRADPTAATHGLHHQPPASSHASTLPLHARALEEMQPLTMPPPALDGAMAPAPDTAALATAPIAPLPALETMAPFSHPAGLSGPLRAAPDAMPDTTATTGKRSAMGAGMDAELNAELHAELNAAQDAHAGANAGAPPQSSSRAHGAAARARAAAQAAAAQDVPRRDPARVRLAVLGAVLALVAGTLAGVYWYALTSPGPGASLPPVPMPPPGASGAAPVIAVAPPPESGEQASAADTPAGGMADITGYSVASTAGNPPSTAQQGAHPLHGQGGQAQARPPVPAPHGGGSRMPSDDELQRALQQQAAATPTAPAQPGRSGVPAQPYNAPPPAGAAPVPPSGAADIHVLRGAALPRLASALQEGYQAFMAGDYQSAAQAYSQALRQDPNNRDALLGNATIAARRNDTAGAASSYQRLLELNPADADAQAGLLALRPGDLGQSELRLKELLRRDPGAGALEFALGNLYAQQGRWPDAQQAYFRAYSAMPDNADYAFNLAVGLDRLSQRKLALTYYQRALDLSRSSPAAFDRAAARRRAEQLQDAATGRQP